MSPVERRWCGVARTDRPWTASDRVVGETVENETSRLCSPPDEMLRVRFLGRRLHLASLFTSSFFSEPLGRRWKHRARARCFHLRPSGSEKKELVKRLAR